MIYLIRQAEGMYEDYCETIVAAYTKREDAEETLSHFCNFPGKGLVFDIIEVPLNQRANEVLKERIHALYGGIMDSLRSRP